MDQLFALQIFTRLVELGSFAQTAAKLGVAPATVSVQVAKLEKSLGIPLLARNTRSISVTPEGEALYERALPLLRDFQQLREDFAQKAGGTKGALRVSVPTVTAFEILIPALPGFRLKHPEIELSIDITSRYVDVVRDQYDCAVRVGALRDSGLAMRRIGNWKVVTCAAPQYLERHGVPDSVEALRHHLCLPTRSVMTGRPIEWSFLVGGSPVSVPVYGTPVFDDVWASAKAAEMGLGIVQCVVLAVHKQLERGELLPILEDCACVGPPIQIVYPKTRATSARLRAFIEFFLEIFPRDLLASDQSSSADRSKRSRAEVE